MRREERMRRREGERDRQKAVSSEWRKGSVTLFLISFVLIIIVAP